jgi:hypothetical protein
MSRYATARNKEDLMKVYDAFRRVGAPLYSYLQPGELFGAFLSTGYPQLKSNMDAEMRLLAEQGLINKRPNLVIMPLREIRATKVDYAPMVGDMLGIGKEI